MNSLTRPLQKGDGKNLNPKKLLDQLRDAIRIKHYSYPTEKTYVHWVKRYILFHKAKQGFARHPAEMGTPEIEAFLSHLAQEANVSASTQNQAFNALLFLYRNVLHFEPDAPIHALRAKRGQYLPTVLSKSEVNQVLSEMQGLHLLMARLLYGCGLHYIKKMVNDRPCHIGKLTCHSNR